jgi:hypothetical protein
MAGSSSALRTPASLTAICLILALISPAATYSKFADGPGNCQIIGDPDVYGLGIRLSYYIQWAAVVFASWVAPDLVQPALLSSIIVTISVYANTFRGVTYGSLIAAEWWIVYFMTFGLTLGYIPTSRTSFQSSAYSLGVLSLLWSMIIFAECWVWFKGVDIAYKEGCVIKVFAIFFEVNVYNNRWRTFFKIQSVASCIVGTIFLLGILFRVYISLFVKKRNDVEDEDDKAATLLLKVGSTGFQLLVGAFAILQIEMTMKINNIDVSATPLTSSGQLIPLTGGIFILAATIGAGFKYLIENVLC